MELTGPEKAVLMLLSLDESVAAPVLAELEPADIRKLREVATMMRAIPASALDRVYVDFIKDSQQAVAVPRGGVRYLRRVATKALGEAKAQEIFVDAPQTSMQRLAAADPAALAAVLENEHPQFIAAVLSQLAPGNAAKLIELLPEALRSASLERLATLKEIPAGLLEEVASALTAELPSAGDEALISVDGVARSAAVVRKLGAQAGDALLGMMASENPDLASEIRRSMYSFEDLALLDARALRTVLEAVPSDRLTLALKTASDKLKNHIFGSMSKRAADRIREDLELLGGVRLADVEAAQREIVEQCLRLAAEGTITLEE